METISDDRIGQAMESAVMETFASMLAMALEIVGEHQPTGLDENPIVGTVHFCGEVAGVMRLTLSDRLARQAAATLLGLAADTVPTQQAIRDVIGELAHIVAGNLRTEFLDAGRNCLISTPTITSGSRFKLDPVDIAPIIARRFRHHDQELRVEFCAKEEIGATETIRSDLPEAVIRQRIAGVDVKTTIVQAVIDVFQTLLELEVAATDQVPETAVAGVHIIGSVTLTGEVDGIVNLQVGAAFGKTMAAAMLGVAAGQIESEQEVFDVIREVSNIICANLKSMLADAGLACLLSIPAIAHGVDLQVSPVTAVRPDRFLFSCNQDTIVVEAGLTGEKSPSLETGESATTAPPAAETRKEVTAGVDDSLVDPFKNLGLVMDIPLQVSVELGRSRKRINDVLKLGPGSVVELEQMEGEPVDILINQTLIAKGFVVVEKEKYGIRISEIVSRRERMKSIR